MQAKVVPITRKPASAYGSIAHQKTYQLSIALCTSGLCHHDMDTYKLAEWLLKKYQVTPRSI
jgi:hypothetical protein